MSDTDRSDRQSEESASEGVRLRRAVPRKQPCLVIALSHHSLRDWLLGRGYITPEEREYLRGRLQDERERVLAAVARQTLDSLEVTRLGRELAQIEHALQLLSP